MAKKKFVVACFDDENVLFPAVKKVGRQGIKFMMFIHLCQCMGLDHALGLRETSLHTAGFIYGITGTTTALGGMGWVFTSDWPMNVGGKPHFALPAFIPITFETNGIIFSRWNGAYFLLFMPVRPVCKKTPFSPTSYR